MPEASFDDSENHHENHDFVLSDRRVLIVPLEYVAVHEIRQFLLLIIDFDNNEFRHSRLIVWS